MGGRWCGKNSLREGFGFTFPNQCLKDIMKKYRVKMKNIVNIGLKLKIHKNTNDTQYKINQQ
jgi:hypothetical protein